MQKNTQVAKEAHTELRNCKQEIKEIKKFNEFRAWWTKCQIKVVKNIPVYLLSLHNKSVQENNKLFF